MATIKLTKVNIGPERYYLRMSGLLQEIPKPAEGEIVEGGYWCQQISFDTPSGFLSDNQYATQENGYHWVKINRYAMTKIAPQFITNDILNAEGITEIKNRSEVE